MTITALYNYEIGTTTGTGGTGALANLQALPTPVSYPKHAYQPYSRMVDTGDGGQRGLGYPIVTWHWDASGSDYITRAQRDQLRTFCTTASAPVYIRTRINDDTDAYHYIQAQMIWPLEEPKDSFGVRTQFRLQFRVILDLGTSLP